MINPETYVFDFGKHRGKPYDKVPISYLMWAHFEHGKFELPPDELERISVISKRSSRRQRMQRNFAVGHGWVE